MKIRVSHFGTQVINRAATLRTETRGVHYRTDHPATDDANWQVHIDWQLHRNAPTLTPI